MVNNVKYNEMVSVVMAVYKEQMIHLEKAMDCILNQTYSNFEFLIILDNPDNIEALEYLEKIQEKDNRIVIIRNEKNIGLASSLNKALQYCKGEYIFRMDSDDTCVYDRFEKQLNKMIKENLDLCCGYYKKIDFEDKVLSEGKIYHNANNEKLKKILNYRNIMPHSCWCVKKEVYEKLNGYMQLVPAEDYDFLLRARSNNIKFGMIDEYLLCYRLNEQGISRTGAYRQYVLAEILTRYHNGKIKDNIYDKEILESIYQYYYDYKYNDQEFFEYNHLKSIIASSKLNILNYFKLFKKKAYLRLFARDLKTFIKLRII